MSVCNCPHHGPSKVGTLLLLGEYSWVPEHPRACPLEYPSQHHHQLWGQWKGGGEESSCGFRPVWLRQGKGRSRQSGSDPHPFLLFPSVLGSAEHQGRARDGVRGGGEPARAWQPMWRGLGSGGPGRRVYHRSVFPSAQQQLCLPSFMLSSASRGLLNGPAAPVTGP